MKEEEYRIIRPYLDYDIIIEETKDRTKSEYEYNWVKKVRLKNGEYTKSVLGWYDDPSIVDGEFSRITIEEPSISKRKTVINQLIKHGWKPNEFTDKGFPKLTNAGEPVETLEAVGDFGKALANWYTYSHRQSQIRGFLPHVRSDSRIPAKCNPCGTNTRRAKHSVVANIPRPSSTFGKEMRDLFCAAPGKILVNADVSGLELRMLAHHMGDKDYIDLILNGDIHSYNQKAANLPTRDDAKTMIYALCYGAGNGKLGSIIGGSSKDGEKLKDTFFKNIPSLGTLIDKVKNFSDKYGWLPSIDNSKIFMRVFEGKVQTHKALNTLLQCNGSIVTKRAMVIYHDLLRNKNVDFKQVVWYHDEFLVECNKNDAVLVGDTMIEAIRLAGEYYNLKIPLTGEYKVGETWSIH